MTVRAAHTGRLQYATIQEALAAQQWLTSFQAMHNDWIAPNATIDVSALIPAGTDGALGQVEFELHYDVPSQAEIDQLVDELEIALVSGGVLTAIGDSGDGTQTE